MRFMGTCERSCQGKDGPAAFHKHAPGLAETRSGLLISRLANSSLGQVIFEQNPLCTAKGVLHDVSGMCDFAISGERWLSLDFDCREQSPGSITVLALLFGAISLLYATVGQAGGTAFLALMAFAAFPASEMRPTALALNIVAAAYSTWVFNRNQAIDWGRLKPLLLASLPTAFIGGFIVLNEHLYKSTTGVVLLLAGLTMILRRERATGSDRQAPLRGATLLGAVVGLVSGLTGVGGGVFLAPALIALHWTSPKQTAALSAPFILSNSMVGLVGVVYAGQLPSPHLAWYAAAVLAGAIIGTAIGLRWLSQAATRYVLAAILLAAGIQLLCFG